MRDLADNIKSYLDETLGVSVEPEKWEGASRLPHFLRDGYAFFIVALLETPCLLMVPRDEGETTPATIRKHMAQVQDKWPDAVVYVPSSVSAYSRRRLIEQKVPFVVPGNQMYLPPLGIDLREHFRKVRSAPITFSPSTQAVVLHELLYGKGESYTPSGMASRLGYTVMTLTRAFDELEAASLGEVVKEGRELVLRFGDTGKALWEKAQQFLRSPVKRRSYIRPPRTKVPHWVAGLTALARYSMLAPPARPVYALTYEDWKSLKQHDDLAEMAIPIDPDVWEIEVWSYSPRLFAEDEKVDRLSLYLSLRDSQDERVESALEEMLEAVAW